jgi:hypothetical protein
LLFPRLRDFRTKSLMNGCASVKKMPAFAGTTAVGDRNA